MNLLIIFKTLMMLKQNYSRKLLVYQINRVRLKKKGCSIFYIEKFKKSGFNKKNKNIQKQHNYTYHKFICLEHAFFII